MALISCPECGRKISDTALTCISCGAILKKALKNKVKEEKYEFFTGLEGLPIRSWQILRLLCGFDDGRRKNYDEIAQILDSDIDFIKKREISSLMRIRAPKSDKSLLELKYNGELADEELINILTKMFQEEEKMRQKKANFELGLGSRKLDF